MRKLAIGFAVAGTVLGVGLAAPAGAAGQADPNMSFFSGPGAHAGWGVDRTNAGVNHVIQLDTTTSPSGYAGAVVGHVEGTPIEDFGASSFDVKSSDDVASQGSPRLHVKFSDGGSADLRPVDNTTDWQAVGDGAEWDNNGTPCAYQYAATWSQIEACHPGTTVTGAYLIADGYYGVDHLIDNLSVNGTTFGNAAGSD